MEFVSLVAIFTIYVAFRQWMQHHRRVMIHRERLAAIEKGISLPPLEQEVQRSSWNVQRFLFWFGCVDIAVGVGAFVALSVLLSFPPNQVTRDIPPGIEYLAVIPIAIGVAHLITYFMEARRGRQSS